MGYYQNRIQNLNPQNEILLCLLSQQEAIVRNYRLVDLTTVLGRYGMTTQIVQKILSKNQHLWMGFPRNSRSQVPDPSVIDRACMAWGVDPKDYDRILTSGMPAGTKSWSFVDYSTVNSNGYVDGKVRTVVRTLQITGGERTLSLILREDTHLSSTDIHHKDLRKIATRIRNLPQYNLILEDAEKLLPF